MTIDEAIKHCLEVVEKNEQAKKDGNLWIDTEYEDCCADHRQLAEWLTELKEAKRLLKAAVEDFSGIYDHIFDCDGMCDTCPIHGNRDTCDKWARADEALALIGKDIDVPATEGDTNVGHKSGGWICVEDRLPDDSVEVLAYDTDCGMVIGWYDKKDNCFACDFISPLDAVTHWMPLPELPKDGDTE